MNTRGYFSWTRAALFLPLLFLSCASGIGVLTFQGSMPISEPSTRLYFPESLCNLKKLEMAVYPGKALGVSFYYEDGDMIKATIYIYNGGADSIADGCESETVKAYFAQALEELLLMQKYGKYENVTIRQQVQKELSVSGKGRMALFADCEFSAEGVQRGSYVIMTGYKNQMLKIRYTFPKEVSDIAQNKWQCLLHALGDSAFVCTSKTSK